MAVELATSPPTPPIARTADRRPFAPRRALHTAAATPPHPKPPPDPPPAPAPPGADPRRRERSPPFRRARAARDTRGVSASVHYVGRASARPDGLKPVLRQPTARNPRKTPSRRDRRARGSSSIRV